MIISITTILYIFPFPSQYLVIYIITTPNFSIIYQMGPNSLNWVLKTISSLALILKMRTDQEFLIQKTRLLNQTMIPMIYTIIVTKVVDLL